MATSANIVFKICAAVVAFCGMRSDAGRFLAARQLQSYDLERTMLAELAGGFKRADGSSRLEEFEQAMSPMYDALPKDEHGRLGHKVVRYALHRFFMLKRSWFIRGLDPSSGARGKQDNGHRQLAWSPRAVITVAVRQVSRFPRPSMALDSLPVLPSLLQDSVSRQHPTTGFTLRETAALAAALEDFVEREAVDKLKMSYQVLGLPLSDAPLESKLASLAVATYMTIFLLGHNFSHWTVEEIRSKEFKLFRTKRWKKIHEWAGSVQDNVTVEQHLGTSAGALSFNDTVHVVEALSEQFGRFNDEECREMKRTLLGLEGRQPGRVRLSDFYNASRYGVWGFTEHIEYLRVLGALDESNISNPQVIVANYVTSMPQCLRASSVYSICCRNECEDLMGAIESAVSSPEAQPKQLAALVASLATDTVVKVPRQLSETLLKRLQEVADSSGGKVPIHGRLFAQWMHHAFPRECPYPHKAGVTSPYTPDEWMQETGKDDSQASEQEMSEHIRPDDSCPTTGDLGQDVEPELPWSYAEELITSIDLSLPQSNTSADILHDVLTDWPLGDPRPVDGNMFAFIGLLVAVNIYFFLSVRNSEPTKATHRPSVSCSDMLM